MSEVPREAAVAFSIETKIDSSKSIVSQFHVPLSATDGEIRKQLRRINTAMDRETEFYLLKGLRITLGRDKKTLETQLATLGGLERTYENEFLTSGRKGAFELRGQQKTNVDNQRTSIQAMRDRITQIETEIAELERMQQIPELKAVG